MTAARPLLVRSLPGYALCIFLAAGLAKDARGEAPPTARASGAVKVAASDAVSCTARAILGEQKPGGVDKRLKLLAKQFSKPPFSAYESLRLLEAKELTIAQAATQKTLLPTKKVLKLQFKEKLLVKGKVRLRMHLSITPPKAKAFLPGTLFTIADGGTLLVAGDSYQGGTLIVGITCKSK
jgi:hypothetical protein